LRLGRLSTFVASNKAEFVLKSICRLVQSEFKVVGEDGLGLGHSGILESELVMAHVISIADVFTSSGVLPLNSDLVVTALSVDVLLALGAKFYWAFGCNGSCANAYQ